MGNRSLAHIEKVLTTYPVIGADNIEMVQVLDFHVMAKKGEFKVDDLVVYIECDSILPDGLNSDLALKLKNKKLTEKEIEKIKIQNTRPEFEFLRRDHFKIKAKKYNKFDIISMGIIFKTDILPQGVEITEGLDVTSVLGITRIDEEADEETSIVPVKEISKFNKFMNQFAFYRKIKKALNKKENKDWYSYFPPQSDEDNCQKVYSRILDRFGEESFYVTEKMEGQNISAFYNHKKLFKIFTIKKDFGICSRTRVKDPTSTFSKTAERLEFDKKLKSIGKNLFIRGEHCGPKIQGNIYKFPETQILLFEIWDIDKKKYYEFEQFMEFCQKYGFDTVPVLDNNFKLMPTVQEILNYSNGKSAHGDVLREGIVIRSKNMKVSFKARSPEYLVLHKK